MSLFLKCAGGKNLWYALLILKRGQNCPLHTDFDVSKLYGDGSQITLKGAAVLFSSITGCMIKCTSFK